MKLSQKAQEVLEALRGNHEGGYMWTREGTWASVYLDNARPCDMSPRSFAAHLANLQKVGVYRTQDGYAWGDVLLVEPTEGFHRPLSDE